MYIFNPLAPETSDIFRQMVRDAGSQSFRLASWPEKIMHPFDLQEDELE
jgi:hypothetical protein